MEKLVYVLSHDTAHPGADLRTGLLEKAAPALRAAGAERIAVNVNDEDVAAGAKVTIRNHAPAVRAMVSFWLDNADDRDPCEQALQPHAEAFAGYLVAESVPLRHSPPTGQRTPGANLVTCIQRKPGLDDDTFFDLWNREHKEVALATQSTFSYVRNAVTRQLTEGPSRDGIVEEGFPIEALSNPHVWYDCDSDEEHARRVKRMVASVTAFLDLSVIDSVPMSEYWLG